MNRKSLFIPCSCTFLWGEPLTEIPSLYCLVRDIRAGVLSSSAEAMLMHNELQILENKCACTCTLRKYDEHMRSSYTQYVLYFSKIYFPLSLTYWLTRNVCVWHLVNLNSQPHKSQDIYIFLNNFLHLLFSFFAKKREWRLSHCLFGFRGPFSACAFSIIPREIGVQLSRTGRKKGQLKERRKKEEGR